MNKLVLFYKHVHEYFTKILYLLDNILNQTRPHLQRNLISGLSGHTGHSAQNLLSKSWLFNNIQLVF